MGNVLLAFPNHSDDTTRFTVTFSSGAWKTAHPLDNLKDPLLYKKARSSTATLAATKFEMDLGVIRDVRIVAIPDHNFTRTATIRVRGSNTAGDFSASTVVYDSSTVDVWNILYDTSSLYWGHPSFWDGKLSDEDADGYRFGWHTVLPNIVLARYWRFDFDDTSNSDGFVQMSRIILAPGWIPESVNATFNSSLGIKDDTGIQRSEAGVKYFETREVRRTARLVFNNLEEDESLQWVHEINRKLGVSGQLYFAWDIDDDVHRLRRSFLANIVKPSPLVAASFALTNTVIDLEEVL